MQEALPYKRWDALPPTATPPSTTTNGGGHGGAMALVKDNPVIIFGKPGCFLCHVVRKLLLGLGVNPPVFEIDGDDLHEGIFVNSLFSSNNTNKAGEINNNNEGKLQFPLVFVGGELFGGLDKVMATHLSGELVPILKQAGALWL